MVTFSLGTDEEAEAPKLGSYGCPFIFSKDQESEESMKSHMH